MSTYNGWTVVTIPASPAMPASYDFQFVPIVAVNTSPFTGQQQVQAWSTGYQEISAAWSIMTFTAAQPWIEFLSSLQGMTCVFQFSAAFCAAFPKELTTDGTTPMYYRLKSNNSKWTVNEGQVYKFGMECRQAI